jgi:hypothetical protein
MTPRQLEALRPGRQCSPAEAAARYEAGDRELQALVAAGRITPADLERQDRRTRCAIASRHWHLCTPEARQALQDDPYHFVRSCALLSETEARHA